MTETEQKLKELFKAWKAAHSTEPERFAEKYTFPDWECSADKSGVKRAEHYAPNFRESFCYDGRLTDWQEGRKTILFICREANIADEEHIDKDKKMLLPETTREGNCSGDFWMEKQFCEWEEKHSIKEPIHDPYIKFMRYCAEENGGLSNLNLAYMNLNKRGGFGRCNMDRIKHYVARYQYFIQEEIELISPDIIICGGTFDTVIDIMTCNQCDLIRRLNKKELWCRDFWHPSRGIHENTEKVDLTDFIPETVAESGQDL